MSELINRVRTSTNGHKHILYSSRQKEPPGYVFRNTSRGGGLTSLFVAVAGGEDGGVARQQFDGRGFDLPDQRHRYPLAFDGDHPRDRGRPAVVLKQPEGKEGGNGVGREEERRRGQTMRKGCWVDHGLVKCCSSPPRVIHPLHMRWEGLPCKVPPHLQDYLWVNTLTGVWMFHHVDYTTLVTVNKKQ